MAKLYGLVWVAVAVALGAVFAVGIAPLAHVIPWNWEKKLSVALDMDMSSACRVNPQAEVLLQKLVQRLYPLEPGDAAFSIDVEVVRNPAVNAYASLGGRIRINSGLLQQAGSAEEVAGVLAHEIGHVQHRHIMEGALTHLLTYEGINMVFGAHTSGAEWTQYFLNMDFSRAQETQADESGLQRLQLAHVDNRGFRRFFERMARSASVPAFLSDHPSNPMRAEMAGLYANVQTTPVMTDAEWRTLRAYCGEK